MEGKNKEHSRWDGASIANLGGSNSGPDNSQLSRTYRQINDKPTITLTPTLGNLPMMSFGNPFLMGDKVRLLTSNVLLLFRKGMAMRM
jgi:hypothetical protein